MKKRMMALGCAALLAAGCSTRPPARDDLALKELFGVKLAEPWGGELKEVRFPSVEKGAWDVTTWGELPDCPKVRGRGYYYSGDGVFGGKDAWNVSEIVDPASGDVVSIWAFMSFRTGHFKRGYENDCVRSNGGKLLDHLTGRLGAPHRARYLDGLLDEIRAEERPAKGRFAQEFGWEVGDQIVRLTLWYDDAADSDGKNGSIDIAVDRKDLWKGLMRDGSFRQSLHEFAREDDARRISVKGRICWPESLSGLDERGLCAVRREILRMAFGPAWCVLNDDGPAWTPPPTLPEAEAELLRALDNPNGLVFSTDVVLEWPFDKTENADAKWYERPVLVVKCDGSAGFVTTCGCTDYTVVRTFSLPDGRELTVDDYFAADRIDALAARVRQRLLETVPCDDASDVPAVNLRDRNAVFLRVRYGGICFYFAPYTLFPGSCGVTKAFLTWSELAEFRTPPSATVRASASPARGGI